MAKSINLTTKIKKQLLKIPSGGWQSFWSGIGLLLVFVLENQEALKIPSEWSVVIGMVGSVIFNRFSKYYLVNKDKVEPMVDEFVGGGGKIPQVVIDQLKSNKKLY